MKKLFAMLLVLVMAFGCTAAFAEAEELDIRVLVWKFDDTYGSTVRAAMDNWAGIYSDELGVKINLTMYDAADDIGKQIEQATTICQQGCDFVIINLAEVSNGAALTSLLGSQHPLFYNKQPAATVREVLVDTGPSSSAPGPPDRRHAGRDHRPARRIHPSTKRDQAVCSC